MAPSLTRRWRQYALLKVGYYLPLDTVQPSRRLECFVLHSSAKMLSVYFNFGENRPLITTSSHENLHGFLRASGAKLLTLSEREMSRKKASCKL